MSVAFDALQMSLIELPPAFDADESDQRLLAEAPLLSIELDCCWADL